MTFFERASNPGALNYLKPKLHKRLPQLGNMDFLTEARLNIENSLARKIHDNSGPFLAVALKVETGVTPPINSHYYGSYSVRDSGKTGNGFIRVYALVDVVHAHLPLPRDKDDNIAIERYTAFYAESSGLKVPSVGGYCWVDFKDKQNWTDGIYIGCPDDKNGGANAWADSLRQGSSAFNNTNGSFNVPYPGPGADGEDIPKGYAQVKQVYGDFAHRSLPNGAAIIDPVWARNNIVTIKVVNGQNIQLHKNVANEFADLYKRAVEVSGYKPHIGSWVPRHTLWDPSKPLSLHSWGIAVDFDSKKNKYGYKPNNPIRQFPDFIGVFEGAGWTWGGRWLPKKPDDRIIIDDMHFQRART